VIEEIVSVFLGILSLLAIVAIPVLFGYFILQPVDAALKGVRCPVQFLLGDFFWLMLLVQLPFWYVSRAMRSQGVSVAVALAVLLLLLCVRVWLRGAAILLGLGIFDAWRRGVFLVIVLPVGTFGWLAAVFAVSLALRRAMETRGFSLLVITAILPIAYVCRLLAIWVVSGAAGKTPAGDSTDAAGGDSTEPSNPQDRMSVDGNHR
jgi:hypothetical protein